MARMEDLCFFGLDAKQIQVLVEAYGPDLLPLQERVLREGLFHADHGLMVSAPTSSGKTLLAELSFLAEAKHDRPVILLVPTKALAMERYLALNERYGPLGYRICLSSRDHNGDDLRIAEGTYHLAIIVYEKIRVLLLRHPGLVSGVQLVVVDELQYIADPDRGPCLELLLTRLRRHKDLRFLGLSAVSTSETLARWLRCRLLVDNVRPVELRQGVLCGNRFVYREHNSGREGEERLPFSPIEDEGQLMLETAKHFAECGESCILFWPSRAVCYTAARRLIGMDLPWKKLDTPSGLQDLPKGNLQRFLCDLVPRGVAVHTSDLSPEERAIVEQLAREGHLRVICATSTLAEGINLPVHNVLACRLSYRSTVSGSAPEVQKLEPQRFLNMIGRAGRLGLTSFGRGMVVTASEGDVDGLLDRYLARQTYDLESALPNQPIQSLLMEGIASGDAKTCGDLAAWLSQTFAGQAGLWPPDLQGSIEKTVDRLCSEGLLVQTGRNLVPTGPARMAARWGVQVSTVERLKKLLAQTAEIGQNTRRLLYAVCDAAEMEEIFVPLRRSEWIKRAWSRKLWAENEQHEPEPEFFNSRSRERAAKKALALVTWSNGERTADIERQFEIYGGTIRSLADQASWLIEMGLELVAEMDLPPEVSQWMDTLRRCIVNGLPQSGLGWSSLLAHGFPREFALDLLELGATHPRLLLDLSVTQIEETVPQTWRHLLPEPDGDDQETEQTEDQNGLHLQVDLHRPDRVTLNGASVQVSRKQFQLLAFLASNPGKCVSYDTLLDHVWQGVIVEQAQIPKLKSLICRRAREALGPLGEKILRTIPGHGLVLEADVEVLPVG
ncbi:MAG: DEAD/DEAH box helicase [bacterium]